MILTQDRARFNTDVHFFQTLNTITITSSHVSHASSGQEATGKHSLISLATESKNLFRVLRMYGRSAGY
jgi:hypothetical protein